MAAMYITAFRTSPKQSRIQESIQLILETAAALFARHGYETATTNAIAKHAGISIGSLYRYFPDKETILDTLMADYQRDMLSIFEQVFRENTATLSLPELLDRLIDPFLERHLAQPAYNQILLGVESSPAIARAVQALDEETSRRIYTQIAERYPKMASRQVELAAQVVKAISKAMFNLITTAKEQDTRRRLIEEYKHFLSSYLENLQN